MFQRNFPRGGAGELLGQKVSPAKRIKENEFGLAKSISGRTWVVKAENVIRENEICTVRGIQDNILLVESMMLIFPD